MEGYLGEQILWIMAREFQACDHSMEINLLNGKLYRRPAERTTNQGYYTAIRKL